jgi:hypothetical protein
MLGEASEEEELLNVDYVSEEEEMLARLYI